MNTTLPFFGQTVLIVGNRSYKNMGDELILLGTIRLLLDQGNKIIISAYDPQWLSSFFSQFLETSQITFIHEIPKGVRSSFSYLKKKGFSELKLFKKVDAIIIGGGEILTEESVNAYRYRLVSIFPSLIGRSKTALVNSFRSVKTYQLPEIYLMGGVQAPAKKRNKKFFSYLLSHTKAAYLRDPESVESLKNYGFPDASFFMDTSYFAYDRSAVKIKCSDTPYIVINLNKNAEVFLDQICEDILSYLQKGYQIYYVPVAKGENSTYNDLFYLPQIEKKLNLLSGTIQILDRESDFASFLSTLKGAEIVMSSRLHLFLISSFLGVQTKVYPYQKKILKMQEVIKSQKKES